MFKAVGRGFERWLAVDRYKKDQHIQRALEWILDRANYRALLRLFVEDALSPASGVSKDERRELLACLARADRGEKVTASSLPQTADRSGRLVIGAWLTNACRRDLIGMPDKAAEVVPISCYCDDATGNVIASTFRALSHAESSNFQRMASPEDS
jgi:hypothetical protein